jgi:hypothetical protein
MISLPPHKKWDDPHKILTVFPGSDARGSSGSAGLSYENLLREEGEKKKQTEASPKEIQREKKAQMKRRGDAKR